MCCMLHMLYDILVQYTLDLLFCPRGTLYVVIENSSYTLYAVYYIYHTTSLV